MGARSLDGLRVFSTGIPISSYFPAASNRGSEARSSWKIRQNGGWEARRLACFFDWNTHFVVFSGVVERGLGGLTDLAGKSPEWGLGGSAA